MCRVESSLHTNVHRHVGFLEYSCSCLPNTLLQSKSTQIFEGYVYGLCCLADVCPVSVEHATCQATPTAHRPVPPTVSHHRPPTTHMKNAHKDELTCKHINAISPPVASCHLNGNDIAPEVEQDGKMFHFWVDFFIRVRSALTCYLPISRPPMSMASQTDPGQKRQINFIPSQPNRTLFWAQSWLVF